MNEKRDKLAALAHALRDLPGAWWRRCRRATSSSTAASPAPISCCNFYFSIRIRLAASGVTADGRGGRAARRRRAARHAAALAETRGSVERLISDQGDDNDFTAPIWRCYSGTRTS